MSELEQVLQLTTIQKKLNSLSPENQTLFLRVLTDTAQSSGSRLLECNRFIQHGSTTVLMHVILVSLTAFSISIRLNLEVNKSDLIRGALLHDYFLYDWHVRSWPNSIHGFTHPGKAAKCAREDFDLTGIEENMIRHHMFPLTPVPPTCREGVLLCIADKICAAKETLCRRPLC